MGPCFLYLELLFRSFFFFSSSFPFWRKSNSKHTENRFSQFLYKCFGGFLPFPSICIFIITTFQSPGEMAFMISKTQQAKISEVPRSGEEIQTESANNPVTSQLYLKTSESLDREIVLRRIRQHKTMNKVRNSLQSLFRSSVSYAGFRLWRAQMAGARRYFLFPLTLNLKSKP